MIVKPTNVHHVIRSSFDQNVNLYQTLFFIGVVSLEEELFMKIISEYLEDFLTSNLPDEKQDIMQVTVQLLNINDNQSILIQIQLNSLPHLLEQKIEDSFKQFIYFVENL